jgi:hypothetical protein
MEFSMAQLGARACSTLALLLSIAACNDGPTELASGPPAHLEVTSGGSFSGSVGTVLETPLAVRVVDKEGRAVNGAVVRFFLVQGPGSLNPQSAVTDRTGAAATRLMFGTAAGTYRVQASVNGVATPASFAGAATPGPVARVVVTPGQVRLAAVGDTARLRARRYDAFGNALPATGIVWTAADRDVFTIDQTGLVTGTRALSTGRAIARAGGRADTAFVLVTNPDASPCLGYSSPVTLAVGQAINVSLTDGACIASAAPDDEYVLIPWHGSTVSGSAVSLLVIGSGLAPVTASQSLAPSGGELVFSGTAGERAGVRPTPGFALERRIREMGRREVMPLARRVRGAFGPDAAFLNRSAAIPGGLAVGALIKLNANANASCSSPSLRTGRVAAVSSRAIVVHDTANPGGGFTDEDYRRFALTFDTLVAPVDEAAFGAPTDIDRNGKIVVFFTRAVNELTPAEATFYYAGFFHPRDLLPKEQNGATFCAGSNEGEMFYLFVPDTGGVVNGNRRSVGFVDSVTVGTLAHEYQHLINAGRRAYVNNAATDEEIWLNEGLSHIAEELVFYRATSTAPRRNLGGSNFGTQPYDGLFLQYMAPNFGRLRVFLQASQTTSPYSGGDDLATRGAAWAFLRYAADRRSASDGDVWMRLVNSTSAGFDNLQAVFGPDVVGMVRDWVVSLYTDDYIPDVAPAFTQASWNFRTAFPSAPISPRPYPLIDAVRRMSDETLHAVTLRGGSGAFFRFAVAAGRQASIRVTSSGGVMPPATVRATIVRSR